MRTSLELKDKRIQEEIKEVSYETKPIYPDEYSVEANEVFVSLFIKRKPIVTNLFEIKKFVESFNIFLDL
jgi:hypothetical protein